jgi:hypothetical protein
MQINILALCGSSHRDSLNQTLLDMAALGGRRPPSIADTMARYCRFMTATGKLNMDLPNGRVRQRRCFHGIMRC